MWIFRLGSRGKNDNIVPQDKVLTLANGVTIARLIAVAVPIWLVTIKHYWLAAFILFWLIALMDGVDGFVARRFNQVTKLGARLDPSVDRVVMVSIALSLTFSHVIPIWLLVTVVMRDLLLGSVIIVFCHGRMPAPGAIGKSGTMALFLGLPGFLLVHVAILNVAALRISILALIWFGLALYYLSSVQYANAAIRMWAARK
jgi:cardiolipin synthase